MTYLYSIFYFHSWVAGEFDMLLSQFVKSSNCTSINVLVQAADMWPQYIFLLILQYRLWFHVKAILCMNQIQQLTLLIDVGGLCIFERCLIEMQCNQGWHYRWWQQIITLFIGIPQNEMEFLKIWGITHLNTIQLR